MWNAIKYSDSKKDRPWIRIGVREQEARNALFVDVEDNGIGIPHELRQRVFERFFRAHPDHAEGTGLGLAIAREAAEEAGGGLWFRSQHGVGTVFTAAFPTQEGREAAAVGQPSHCIAHKPMTPSNLEILAYEDTPLGPLCLRRRELLSAPGTVVTEVTLDHNFLMSSYNTLSERALSTLALDLHSGEDLRVLVGGLGLGYTAHAVLASARVARVEVVEYLPQVIDWLQRDLMPLSAELKEEPRLVVTEGDIYARLAEAPTEHFDLILIDVDHAPDDPLSAANTPFYTREGLERARHHLAPGGVLGVWSYAENSPFADALRAVFREVRLEPVTFFNDLVDETSTDWLFFARSL